MILRCDHRFRILRAAVGILMASLSLASLSAAEPLRLTDDGRLKRDPVFAGADEIVYVVQETPVLLRLMRLDLTDGSTVPLHPDAAKSEFEPAFSADGRYLAFVQSRGNLSLALVIRDLREDRQAEVRPMGGFSGMCSPAVSPDGTRVLYAFPDGGRQHLYSINAQAEDRRQITDSQGITNWPHFSPDGRQIVFGSSRDGVFDIYVTSADGSNVRRLTDSPAQDIRPRFSPDGRRIAFTSNRDGNYEVYVMNADGSGQRRLTDHPERDDFPAWHPDGRQLVFVAERDGRHDLHLIDVP